MLTAALLFNGVLGTLVAFVVLRADARRRENQLLALACLLDDILLVGVAWLVASGAGISSPPVVHFVVVCRVLVVHPLLEFAYAFPSRRAPPGWMRWLGLSATLAAIGVALTPATAAWFDVYSAHVFFIPYFLMTLVVLIGNLRRLEQTRDASGVRLIIAVMLMRWIAELSTQLLVRPLWPSLYPGLLAFDLTAAAFVMKVATTYALLRHGFFRVRGLIAEAVLCHLLGLAAFWLLLSGIEVVLAGISQPFLQRIALACLACLPLLGWQSIRRARPQLEAALLYPLDPLRSVQRSLLERVVQQTATLVEPAPICALTHEALAELSGGKCAFLRCPETSARTISLVSDSDPELDVALAKHLEDPAIEFLRRTDGERMSPEAAAGFAKHDVDLVVAVRFGDKLLGALSLQGGEIDQDTVSVALALVSNLGSRLAHAALYQHAFQLQRQLEESRHLATLGSFAAAIAHDIRTPLTSVQLNLQLLRGSAKLTVDEIEGADIALDELKRMAAYISEILDYAKPVRLERDDVDVRHLIEDTARSFEALLGSRRLSLDLRLGHATPLTVRADAARIRQILVNLLENAAAASQPGGTIRLRSHAVDGDRVAIEVADDGRGIATEDLGRIFDPFFTTRADGTGLGLAIVKKLVLAHAGEVSVRSNLAAGSTFTIVLPT
jgi:signal transduction histidine kinase